SASDQTLIDCFESQIARSEIVASGVAGAIGESLRLTDLSSFLAHNDYQLNFVIKFVSHCYRQLDGSIVMVQRHVEFAEEHRFLRHLRADLLGMPPVIQANADDFLRMR